jgi:hypothetical protein
LPQDKIHPQVRNALLADGWTVTHDRYPVRFGMRVGQIDIAATGAALGTQALAATRGNRKIAVEVKSFRGGSKLVDLAHAIGQYLLYKSWLSRLEPERTLYLAISQVTARTVFRDISASAPMQDYGIRLLVVNIETERIVEWID